jgi:hypothetical protein
MDCPALALWASPFFGPPCTHCESIKYQNVPKYQNVTYDRDRAPSIYPTPAWPCHDMNILLIMFDLSSHMYSCSICFAACTRRTFIKKHVRNEGATSWYRTHEVGKETCIRLLCVSRKGEGIELASHLFPGSIQWIKKDIKTQQEPRP